MSSDRGDSESGFDALLRDLARGPTEASDPAADRARLGTDLGPYHLLEVLGRGGLGTVYLAEDTRLQRRVALKLLHAAAGTAAEREAVLREARAAAAVVHQNVASLFGVEEHQGRTLLVMEYVPGQPLRALIPARGLPWPQAFPLALQVAQGLSHAHGLGIVHRDLKPDNVRVTPEGVARILDFGLARPEATPGTPGTLAPSAATTPAGTPRYMAPEVLAGAPADRRSDVFAFGVLLHELITGAPAAAGARPPRRGPRAAARLAARCLAPQPERRPTGGKALVEALARQSPARRLVRKAVLAVGLASAAVAGVLGLALSSGPRPVQVEQLTHNLAEAPVTQAALSPDGATLAFVDTRGLLLLELASRRERQLLGPAEVDAFSFLSWFDDGQRLLVRRREEPGGSRLAVVEVGTGRLTDLGPLGPWRFAAPSPDGARIAYVRLGPNEKGDLGVFEVARPQVLRTVYAARADERLFSHLCWSPDGSRLAFGRYSGKFDVRDASLRVADAAAIAATEARTVATDPGIYQQSLAAAFAFTGPATLTWASRGADGQRLRSVDLGSEAAAPQELGRFEVPILDRLTSDRSGRRLAFVGFAKQADVWAGRLTQPPGPFAEVRRLTLSARDEWPSDWTPDGQRVLVTAVGPQGPFAAELPATGGVLTPLGAGAGGWTTWPVRSPWGTLFWRTDPRDPSDRSGLWRREPDGAEVALSTTVSAGGTEGPERPPPRAAWVRCAGASGRCVAAQQQPGGLVFDELSADGSLHRPEGAVVLDVPWTRGFALSPDGERVAVADQARRRLVVATLAGQVLQELRPERGAVQFAGFTPDGAGLVVTTLGGAQHSSLERWGLDGARTVLWTSDWAWLTHPVVSPDGGTVAFAVTPFHGNAWALERR